eukprot:gnl/Trimastix_PCT/4500.p1 GENE.gnl/Trimastix_PCT/4500~~gnl/Trimastix_PCT/4500.p1  ORF type:complete len:146 (+),score=8.58 gnl/Trimastix_PCT/4500:91-528(+)
MFRVPISLCGGAIAAELTQVSQHQLQAEGDFGPPIIHTEGPVNFPEPSSLGSSEIMQLYCTFQTQRNQGLVATLSGLVLGTTMVTIYLSLDPDTHRYKRIVVEAFGASSFGQQDKLTVPSGAPAPRRIVDAPREEHACLPTGTAR